MGFGSYLQHRFFSLIVGLANTSFWAFFGAFLCGYMKLYVISGEGNLNDSLQGPQ